MIKIPIPITANEREIFAAGYNVDDPTKQTETLSSLLGRILGDMASAGYQVKVADFDETEIGTLTAYFDELQTNFGNIVNFQKTDIVESRGIKQPQPEGAKSRGDLDELPAELPPSMPIVLAGAFLTGGWPAVLAAVMSHVVRMLAQQLVESTAGRLTNAEEQPEPESLKDIAKWLEILAKEENIVQCPMSEDCYIYTKSRAADL